MPVGQTPGSWFGTIFRTLAVLLPLYFALNSFSAQRFHVFSPARLQAISQAAIAANGGAAAAAAGTADTGAVLRAVAAGLQAEYGDVLVRDYDDSRWVFNVAGGATGQMMILHASLTEYVILFGSAAGTEGHSGVHPADDYFTILAGRQTAGFLGEMKPRAYYPGDQHYHPRGTSAHYRLDNGSWALELAQGFIPGMLPFGLGQMPLSFDIDSTWRTVWYTGLYTTANLLRGKI